MSIVTLASTLLAGSITSAQTTKPKETTVNPPLTVSKEGQISVDPIFKQQTLDVPSKDDVLSGIKMNNINCK